MKVKFLVCLLALGLSACGRFAPQQSGSESLSSTEAVEDLASGEEDSSNENNGSDDSVPAEEAPAADQVTSLQAFSAQGSLYPLVAQRCVACHNTIQSPFFASTNTNTAFDNALSRVNLDFPAESLIVKKVGVGKHSCWGDCLQNSTEIVAAITKWKSLIAEDESLEEEGETPGVVGPFGYVLPPAMVPVAPTLPDAATTPTQFSTLRFPLAAVIPGEVGELLIDIQSYNGFYRIKDPRFTNLVNPIFASQMRVLVNGIFRPNESDFESIRDRAILAPGGNFGTRSNLTMLMTKGPAGATDIITVAYEVLGVNGVIPASRVLAGTALYTTNCQGCHMALNVSAKIGRTAAQIQSAIAIVPAMSALANLRALSPAQIATIEEALLP